VPSSMLSIERKKYLFVCSRIARASSHFDAVVIVAWDVFHIGSHLQVICSIKVLENKPLLFWKI
jgi:hypothetical protein